MPRFARDLKMHLLKQTINYLSPRLIGKIPDVQVKQPQSELILRVWQRLEDALGKEASIGARDDKNFSHLLETVKRALIFLCEEDRYYRRWLGLLILLLAEETSFRYRSFTFEEALNSSPRPLGLAHEQFEQNKQAFFENWLCGYLYALEQQPESVTTSIKEAYDRSGAIQLPTSHKRMAFTLAFERLKEDEK